MHDLTFAVSPVDACATCMSLQNELKSGTRLPTERAKTALQLHLHEARLAYKLRWFGTRTSRRAGLLDVPDFLCINMQAILQTPKVLTSQMCVRCNCHLAFDVCQVNANFAFLPEQIARLQPRNIFAAARSTLVLPLVLSFLCK